MQRAKPASLFLRLLFLRFLCCLRLLRLRRFVLVSDDRSVDRVDVDLLDTGLARNGDVEGVDQFSLLALELARLDGSVRNFLESGSAGCLLGDFRLFLERRLALFLLHSPVTLGGRGFGGCLGGALVGTCRLRAGRACDRGNRESKGNHFEHLSSNWLLFRAPSCERKWLRSRRKYTGDTCREHYRESRRREAGVNWRHMRVLLVEDDPGLAAIIKTGFAEQGVKVVTESTYADGQMKAVLGTFDVIILDVMLPGGNGFDLCRELRKREVATPILMLTARDTVDDRVAGLEVGADDYLTKPFAFRELLARVRALARRRGAPLPDTLRVSDLEVDLNAHRVRRAGKSIELTAKEFSLLEFFVIHHGQVVDRAAITAHVWDENHDPFTNVLEVLVRRLRRKIDDDYSEKLIQTLRGAGYRFGD